MLTIGLRENMTKNQQRKRIDEEMVCADSLVHCLKTQCGCQEVTVEREEDDPPDFWFTIDGERYAGEVTSIVVSQAYHALCRKFEDAIRESSQKGTSIKGTYALLIIHHPKIPRSTSSEWRDLVRQAASFIDATRHVESTGEARLLEGSDGHLDIKKLSDQGATIGTLVVNEVKWESEVQDELRQLIEERVKEKRMKLEKKGIPGQRTMLLLYDAYGFGDVGDAEKVLAGVPGYDWFHSVFWAASFTDRPNELSPVDPGRVGRFIYSANGRWWNISTMGST